MIQERYIKSKASGRSAAFSATSEKESFGSLLFRQLALSPSEYIRVNADLEWDMFCSERKSGSC